MEGRGKLRAGPVRWALAAALVVVCSGPSWANRVELQARVGWDGWVRYGSWNPVIVEVSAAEPFQGWLDVEVTQEFGTQRVHLRAPVQLAPRGRRRWQFAAWLSDARRPVKVRAVDSSGEASAEVEAALSPERAVASVVGYVGEEPPLPPKVEGGGSRVVARLSEEDLPDRPSVYASMDLLVLGGLDPARMNADQRDALETWVLHGGRVVVAGSMDLETLPWMRVGQEARAAVAAADLASVRAEAIQHLIPEPGARPVLERGRVVAVVRDHGLGQVVRWAAPAARVPPTSPLWFLALPNLRPQGGPPELHPHPRAPLGEAAAWLGAYALLWIVAVGFADGKLFRWLLAGAVLLVAALAGTPVAADRLRQAAATLEVRGGKVVVEGRGWTYSWGFAAAPYRGPYTYTLPPADAVWVSGQFAQATVTFEPHRTALRVFQDSGARVRIWWERTESVEPAPLVRWEGQTVRLQHAGGGPRGLVLFRGQVSGLEAAGPELVAGRWEALPAGLEAAEALKWVRPDADTIMEGRPVVAWPDPPAGGWRFVVGPAP